MQFIGQQDGDYMRIFILIMASLLIAVNVLGSPFSNETMENYEKRYQDEFVPPQTVCGDGLCEGREFETCAEDCKKQIIQQETKQESTELYDKLTSTKIFDFEIGFLIVIFVIAAIIIVYYILKRKKLN